MSDLSETRDDEWEDEEEGSAGLVVVESDNVMQFSDYVEPDEKKLQKQRITELRRRAEERQDWKRISHEYDWDLDQDELIEEA